MSGPRLLDAQEREEALRVAIEKHTQLVLTIRHEHHFLMARSNFVPRSFGAALLAIEPPVLEQDIRAEVALPLELPKGTRLGVTFRRGHNKCMFASDVVGPHRVAINAQTRIDALLINKPRDVWQLQRRHYERVAVPPEFPVRASLHFDPLPGQTGAAAETRIECDVLDLSAGGARMRLAGEETVHPAVGRRMKIVLTPASGASIEVRAIYRHCAAEPDGSIAWGVQFVDWEADIAHCTALHTLTRLIGTLYRMSQSAPVIAPGGP